MRMNVFWKAKVMNGTITVDDFKFKRLNIVGHPNNCQRSQQKILKFFVSKCCSKSANSFAESISSSQDCKNIIWH